MNEKITFWSHRGYKANKRANSRGSLVEAYNKGFRNIEFDLWYLNGNLRLNHDKPKKEEVKNLPLLRKYLKQYGSELKYWMDFKNLNKNNIENVLIILKRELDKNQIPYSSINFAPYEINLEKGLYLLNKARESFKGINVVSLIDSDVLKNNDLQSLYKFYTKNKIRHLSVESKIINEKFIKLFKDIKVYAWTVDNKNELERLKKLGIKNICTNLLLP